MVFENLNPSIQNLLRERGFTKPTLAQQLAMPPILKGENVLLIAATGEGKTESCMLPLFNKIMENREAYKPISILFISPTRSLNRDLLDRIVWWGNKLDIEVTVRHGDTSQSERAIQREMPSHIFITTPEALQTLLVGRRMREHLKNVKHVVIDEIHELVESKRGVQLAIALERLAELAGNFQRIGLSATVGTPELVAEFLSPKAKIIHAESQKKYNISVECPKPGPKDTLISDDLLINPTTVARLTSLYELIKYHTSVLAFTNTRETAEVLSSRLRQLDRELKQEVHHGSLSKERRIGSEQKFKAQQLKSLIATSSLELGIDIGSCDLVVQYLSPRQVSRLIQRVGRSGHKVGETSKGIILSGEEDLFESTIIAQHAMEKKLEEVTVHEGALDVLATQILGMCFEEQDIPEEKLYKIVKRSYPYKDLTKKELADLLRFLESIRLIWLNPSKAGLTVRKTRKAYDYYFENLSMIPDTVQYRVISIIQGEPIGSLDEDFVAEHGKPGEKFICSGRAWKVIQVDGNKVIVEPIEDIESAIPAWEGELIPVPYEIAQDVGKLRRFIGDNLASQTDRRTEGASNTSLSNLAEKIKEKYKIDSNSAKEMIRIVEKHREKHAIPDDKTFLIETYKDFVIIHSCLGSMVNDTIGRYLAAILTGKTGTAVTIKADPYRIMMQTTAKPEDVKKALLEAENVEEVLSLAIARSSLFKHRFVHVARRFGVLRKGVAYDRINLGKIMVQYDGTPVWKETLREIFVDKMDIAKAIEVLDHVKKGKIKLLIEEGLSYLGELGLIHQFAEIMKPAMPQEEIFKAFRKRLLTTRIRLLCMNCADYNLVKEARAVEDEPECPKCGSRLMAALHKSQQKVEDIVKKRLKKKELGPEDLHTFQTARRSADLVLVYGKKAVITMAGHGVGPETAARILSRMHPTKEKLLRDILEAEKTFARTKVYWT
jgi:ATP-dependent Lhr-like helicase